MPLRAQRVKVSRGRGREECIPQAVIVQLSSLRGPRAAKARGERVAPSGGPGRTLVCLTPSDLARSESKAFP